VVHKDGYCALAYLNDREPTPTWFAAIWLYEHEFPIEEAQRLHAKFRADDVQASGCATAQQIQVPVLTEQDAEHASYDLQVEAETIALLCESEQGLRPASRRARQPRLCPLHAREQRLDEIEAELEEGGVEE
jgi:hypothetical protein